MIERTMDRKALTTAAVTVLIAALLLAVIVMGGALVWERRTHTLWKQRELDARALAAIHTFREHPEDRERFLRTAPPAEREWYLERESTYLRAEREEYVRTHPDAGALDAGPP
jgi:hypothetical protein